MTIGLCGRGTIYSGKGLRVRTGWVEEEVLFPNGAASWGFRLGSALTSPLP